MSTTYRITLNPFVPIGMLIYAQDPADPVSAAAAMLSLAPQGLVLAYVVLLWATREAELGLLFAGQMLNEAVNVVLKRIIQEERPPGE